MVSVREMAFLCGLCVFATSFTTGILLTSAMCRLAWRFGALDKPDGFLKNHERTTPTLGGVPFVIGLFAGLSILFFVYAGVGSLSIIRSGWTVSLTGLGIAVLWLHIFGIRDDLTRVNPLPKLMFQVVAATIVVGSGFVIRQCGFFGEFELSLGVFAVPFTIFWLVGSCNAFNFIDGMDGLASGIGVIISLVLAVMGFMTGAYGPAIVALALGGGLGAVLLFNIHPAKIFLGDSGSQVMGLIFGFLTIGIGTQHGSFQLPSMGLILSVPILDATLSILRRYSQSESPARGDHRHIHHCLRHQGLSVHQSVLFLCMFVGWTSLMGILYYYGTGKWVGASAAALVILELYLGIRLGCLDSGLLLRRFARAQPIEKTAPIHLDARLEYMTELKVLWERMKPAFEQLHLDRVILTLEGLGDGDQKDCEIYQWTRSEGAIASLLANQWTKRFSLTGDEQHVAVLRLESAQEHLSDEERIELLLNEIRENMSGLTRMNPCNEPHDSLEFAPSSMHVA